MIEPSKLKSYEISDIIHQKYINNCKYKVPNAYIFKWESDFFIQKDNGYCYEFEIKVSKADFKKDFEKSDKHEVLKNGFFINYRNEQITRKRPNKFYYVAPIGIIDIKDVPKYAGLMVINDKGFLETIKEAPFCTKKFLNLKNCCALNFIIIG